MTLHAVGTGLPLAASGLDPMALKALGICTAILFFKMFAIGLYQGMTRRKHHVYTVPEDAKLLTKEAPAEQEHPDYLRACNAYRNDFENIPIFIALAWATLHLHSADQWAPMYFAAFTLARCAHTFCYLKALQPWRTLAFALGLAVNFALSIHLLLTALR